MKQFWLSIVVGIFTVLALSPVLAKPDARLFHAEAVVKDRSQAEWHQGVRKALADVLIKVSGDQDINEQATLSKSLPSLSTLVQSYRYQRKALYGDLNQLFLDVRFDPVMIQQLLESANQTAWSETRPTTIVWLTLPVEQGRREILARDQHPQYVQILEASAEKRGIPMILPVMDLNDISSLSAHDVDALNVPLVREASRRYQADSVLIVNVSFDDDQYWHAHNAWVSGATKVTWTSQDASIDNLLAQTVNQLTERMFTQYTQLRGVSSDQNAMLVRVTGVNGIDDYTKVIDYLKQLEPITEVEVDTIETDAVVLSIMFGGNRQNLEQTVQNAKGNRLVPVDQDALGDSNAEEKSVALVYRWLEPIAAGAYNNNDL